MTDTTSKPVWIVSKGDGPLTVLGISSTEEGAEKYRQELVKRYASGGRFKFLERPIAPYPGQWDIGIAGPEIVQAVLDPSADHLPGAWVVRVNGSQMVGVEFSLSHRHQDRPEIFHQGAINIVCEAYGPTPETAYHKARKALRNYLDDPRSRQRHYLH